MTVYFWFSVSLVLAGLLCLLIDVLFEAWKKSLRMVVAFLIAVAIGLFLKFVVFHEDSLVVGAHEVHGQRVIQVVVANMNDDDLQDVDLTIRLKSPVALLSDVTLDQTSYLCKVFPPMPVALSEKEDNVQVGPRGIKTTLVRVRCDKLPDHAYGIFDLKIENGTPSEVNIKGHYRGLFKVFWANITSRVQS